MKCPFYFIANIPLVDFHVGNGSTEFWLGSHHATDRWDQITATAADVGPKQIEGDPTCNVRPEIIEARRAIRPPVQPVLEKGDMAIRDLRLWHAGMPNDSEAHRIMIAIGYQVRLLHLQTL